MFTYILTIVYVSQIAYQPSSNRDYCVRKVQNDEHWIISKMTNVTSGIQFKPFRTEHCLDHNVCHTLIIARSLLMLFGWLHWIYSCFRFEWVRILIRYFFYFHLHIHYVRNWQRLSGSKEMAKKRENYSRFIVIIVQCGIFTIILEISQRISAKALAEVEDNQNWRRV